MEGEVVATLTHDDFKAEIYSLNIPGEFKVIYSSPAGEIVEEQTITGISSYHQRQPEIVTRLHDLSRGAAPHRSSGFGAS